MERRGGGTGGRKSPGAMVRVLDSAALRARGNPGRRNGCCFLAGAEVYQFIVFRGPDIKELQVVQRAPEPAPAPKFEDPAIVSAVSQGHRGYPGQPFGMPPMGPGGYGFGYGEGGRRGRPGQGIFVGGE